MSDTDPNPLWRLAEKVWAEADGKIIRLDAVGVIYGALIAELEQCAVLCETTMMCTPYGGTKPSHARYVPDTAIDEFHQGAGYAALIRERIESGANAAANSPALKSAAATRTATTEIQND